MLHVFHVDGGRMVDLDIGIATGAVRGLQLGLQEETHVPPNEQVLLVSGGEILEANKPVSSYGAGTDSNPIFLVSRCSYAQRSLGLSSLSRAEGTEELASKSYDLRLEFNAISSSSVSFELIQRYAELAKQLTWNTDRGFEICKRLVDEQHLLHQGWSALVANLEDTESNFSKKIEKFNNYFIRFTASKPRARELLQLFLEDLKILGLIPLPSSLIPRDQQRALSLVGGTDAHGGPGLSLLEWISSKDADHSLVDIANEAEKLLDEISDSNVEDLMTRHAQVKDMVNLTDMKEIRGISKRLSQLDEYLHKAGNLQRDQKQLGEAVILQEQKVLGTLRDYDVLSGACRVQRDSVAKMIQTLQNLTEIASKFKDSKVELLENIRKRLADWITQTYQLMHESNNGLTIYAERVLAARKRFQLLQQIHEAPTIYATAVTEVLRRKSFSEDYQNWASQLVEKCVKLKEEESELRFAFSGKLERHFLKGLFEGLDDEMPDFATENPPLFDKNLPPLTADDLRNLRQSATSLAPLLQVSQRNIFERLAVHDPRETSGGGMRREASFFSSTPPKFLGSCTKFPSSQWLSGDENLDFSPTKGLIASSPPSSTLEYSPLTLVEMSSPIKELEKRAPPVTTAKSAPIRIPSRAPSDGMSTSRQLSEKSSRFGTPEEDLPMSSEDTGPSPPELISRSQLKAEIGQLSCETVLEEMGKLSIKEVMTPKIPATTQTSFEEIKIEEMEGLEQSLNERSRELEVKEFELQDEKRKYCELTLKYESLEKELAQAKETQIREVELEELRDEVAQLKMRLENCREQEEKLKALCFQEKSLVSSLIKQNAEDVECLKELLSSCSRENEQSVSYCREILETSALRLEKNLQEGMSLAQEAVLKLEKDEWKREMEKLKQEVEVEKQKVLDAEKHVENYEALIRQKDEVLSLLQEEVDGCDLKWVKKLEEAKSEIIKQLTIEHELQLDALREGFKNQIQEKEEQEQQLKENLREKMEVIAQLRKEQDQLVASQYDRESSYPAVDPELLKREHEAELRQLRLELEKEYKDKLQFLTKGMEERNIDSLDRCQKEKVVELRMAKEVHDREIETIRTESEREKEEGRRLRERVGELEEELKRREEESSEEGVRSEQSGVGGGSLSPADDVEVVANVMTESVMPSALKSSEEVGEASAQTRIRMKDMQGMISVSTIRENDSVLVTYSDFYDSFIVFNTTPSMYFLKEHSARKMGLQKHKTLNLARISTNPEYCQIKKEQNRYKLAVGTRFYRVEVEPWIDSA